MHKLIIGMVICLSMVAGTCFASGPVSEGAVINQEFGEEFTTNVKSCKTLETKNGRLSHSYLPSDDCGQMKIPIGRIIAENLKEYFKVMVMKMKNGKLVYNAVHVVMPDRLTRVCYVGADEVDREEYDISDLLANNKSLVEKNTSTIDERIVVDGLKE